MIVRAVCQVRRRIGYALAIWNPSIKQWVIDSDEWDEPHPLIPMMEKGWEFQYFSDDEWKSLGVIFSPSEEPSEELFEACA